MTWRKQFIISVNKNLTSSYGNKKEHNYEQEKKNSPGSSSISQTHQLFSDGEKASQWHLSCPYFSGCKSWGSEREQGSQK
jgi:hypothetical protein